MITSFKIFESSFKQLSIPVVNRYVYHSSNPIFRKSILEKGLIPKKGDKELEKIIMVKLYLSLIQIRKKIGLIRPMMTMFIRLIQQRQIIYGIRI
jgi:hypothetical protein